MLNQQLFISDWLSTFPNCEADKMKGSTFEGFGKVAALQGSKQKGCNKLLLANQRWNLSPDAVVS